MWLCVKRGLIGAVVALMAFPFGLLGGAGIWFGVKGLVSADDPVEWPTTPGVIVESRVVEYTTEDNRGDTLHGFYPVVRYGYDVGGSHLESDNVNGIVSRGPLEGAAKRVVERYPAGAQVTVFYEPQNSHHSLLEPGSDWWMGLVVILFGLAGIAASGVCIWGALRTWRGLEDRGPGIVPTGRDG